MIYVRLATKDDIKLLAPLFDAYRVFYRQESDLKGGAEFLNQRFLNNQSRIYIAFSSEKEQEQAVGFTQLYPLFSSVTMQPMILLNDLFVTPSLRGKGVGKKLIDHVKSWCKETNQKGIALSTGISNPAQKLYEREGFKKDTDLFYFWQL